MLYPKLIELCAVPTISKMRVLLTDKVRVLVSVSVVKLDYVASARFEISLRRDSDLREETRSSCYYGLKHVRLLEKFVVTTSRRTNNFKPMDYR